MKFIRLMMFTTIAGTSLTLRAQDATQPMVDLHPKTNEQNVPAATPAATPAIPELSQLDEIFNKTSLGKTADEFRQRVELRKLQNEVANEPAVITAKRAAESARTDLEKRQRLRDYYNVYYGRMAVHASNTEMKAALDKSKTEHLALLYQPRVRPEPGVSPTIPPAKHKHKHRKSE
jgi:hypothetical protein